MLTQRNELIRALLENGWQVIETEESDLDWWADEILVIESVWSPKGTRGYLTFLVDPMHDGLRKKRESVWAVAVSTERLADQHSAGSRAELSLGHNWKQRLPEFVRRVNSLRQNGAAV